MLRPFLLLSAALFTGVFAGAFFWSPILWALLLLVPLFVMGLLDATQSKHAVRRNFPVIGNLRYVFEMIRPEISQYFIESNTDGMPFSREFRSIAYQRAKRVLATTPFGTQRDLYEVGREWLQHSLGARSVHELEPGIARVKIGRPGTAQPYDASLLNISAMSYGSLSKRAIEALSQGAKRGGFYHNTGEGGISPYHLRGGADLVWQVGTGYFGCRAEAGAGEFRFNPEAFARTAQQSSVKMIEIKLSQGAKPGHGGILPKAKITPEIAAIRGVSGEHDVVSPPTHSAFDGPLGLLEFVTQLRELSGGKPVGFKLCIGSPAEFLGIVRAMHESGLGPDFITVDGAEGGTGAAPLEFSNSMGWPLTEGLIFVHNALVGFGLREDIKLIASGKVITGFHMAKRLALGADLCNSARGMMFSLGCIQARRCHANDCPVGVATQEEGLVRGLVVADKAPRVQHFHAGTIEAFLELLGATGLEHPNQLGPHLVQRRVSSTEVQNYSEIFEFLEPGELLGEHLPLWWQKQLRAAPTGAFGVVATNPLAKAAL